MTLSDRVALWLRRIEGPVLVACSGGGDSVALLHLLKDWGGRQLEVITIDHGLRAEAAAEAAARDGNEAAV